MQDERAGQPEGQGWMLAAPFVGTAPPADSLRCRAPYQDDELGYEAALPGVQSLLAGAEPAPSLSDAVLLLG